MRADRGSLKKEKVSIYVIYTLLFCVFTAGIFAVLILTHKSFIQYHDAYRQGAFRLIEYKNQLQNIMSGEGFSWWSWYEGTGLDEPLENFVDPFSFIGALFPVRYLELGFTVAALLRMYFGGIAFLILGNEVELKREQNLLGAILYVFSACFIGLALRQSENLKNIFLFPLLVASVERIYKGKRPVMFILTVAYYMLISFYFSYMSGITIILYIILRFFAYNDSFRLKEFILTIGRFIGYGVVGIMIPAFSWIFAAYTLTRASMESTNAVSYGFIPDSSMLMSFGKVLLGTGASYDYEDIGLPIMVIMLIPIALRHCNKKATNTIMTGLLLVMMQIPFLCSMFNGFSYLSYRWSYTLALFAVWTAVEQFDLARIREKGSIALAATGVGIITLWTLILYEAGAISVDKSGKLFIPLQLAAGAITLLLLLAAKRKNRITKAMYAAFFIVPLLSLSLGWTYGIGCRIDNFAKNASVINHLNESALRAGNQIEDSGFYRIDSVDGIFRHAELTFPANENIWWKTNNLFIYNSRIPETLTEFNIETGNSYGYARRVYMLSNGNRMGLDFLYGVRYFLGSDTHNEGTDASDYYADYGFENAGRIDGVNVFKNKYDTGLGYVFDKAMLRSDYEKLGRLEREQALLQVAVVPDEQAEDCGVQFVGPADIDLDIADIPFEVSNTDGVAFEEGKLIAEKGNASFTISVKEVPDSQLIVSFDNLMRNAKGDNEGGSYLLYADNGVVESAALNQHSRQGMSGLTNHDLNMGHCKGDYEITIKLPYKGVYTYDRLYVSAMETANYDRYAEECIANKLTVSEYDDRHAEGTIDTEEGGILFLSMPEHDNWDVYVDGEKAREIDNLDTTFLGACVPGGEHSVVLKYNNRYVKYGSIISALGLISLAILLVKHKRHTTNQ